MYFKIDFGPLQKPTEVLSAVPPEYWHDGGIVVKVTDQVLPPPGNLFPAPFVGRKWNPLIVPRVNACEPPSGGPAPVVEDWQAFVERLRDWCFDAILHSYVEPEGEPIFAAALATFYAGATSFEAFAQIVGMGDEAYNSARLLLPDGGIGTPRRVVPPSAGDKPRVTKPISASQFDEASLGKRAWIMEPLAHRKLMTLVVATGGSGKSTFVQQIGIAVALGMNIGPFILHEKCNVLIMNREDDVVEQQKRLAAACKSMGVDQAALDGSLYYFDPTLAPLVTDTQQGRLRVVGEHTWGKDLRRELKEHAIGLLILDPLVKFHSGLDENSNADQEQIARAALSIAADTGVAVLICHHAHKHSVPSLAASRGGSALPDASRIGFYMAKSDKEPVMTLHHLKNTMGSLLEPTRWRFRGYALANGEEAAALEPMAIEPMSWQNKSAVLEMVAEGRGDDHAPWPSSFTLAKDARLDVAIERRWDLPEGTGREVLEAYAAEGLIAAKPAKVRKSGGGSRTISAWTLAEAASNDEPEQPKVDQ